jgi:hypothetical protein
VRDQSVARSVTPNAVQPVAGDMGDQIPQGPDKPALLVIGIGAANDPEHNALLVVEAV